MSADELNVVTVDKLARALGMDAVCSFAPATVQAAE